MFRRELKKGRRGGGRGKKATRPKGEERSREILSVYTQIDKKMQEISYDRL